MHAILVSTSGILLFHLCNTDQSVLEVYDRLHDIVYVDLVETYHFRLSPLPVSIRLVQLGSFQKGC